MKRLPQALAAHVATGETTLCRAWRVTCRDGFRLGLTEHDQRLVFDGTVFEPGTGFAATEASSASGLAAPGAEVRGGFSSEAITEADLAAGRYDGARGRAFSRQLAGTGGPACAGYGAGDRRVEPGGAGLFSRAPEFRAPPATAGGADLQSAL